MDHVLNAIEPHYNIILDLFIKEQNKNNYKKLSDNPYYKEVKTLVDSMNVLRKYLGWGNLKLSEEIDLDI